MNKTIEVINLKKWIVSNTITIKVLENEEYIYKSWILQPLPICINIEEWETFNIKIDKKVDINNIKTLSDIVSSKNKLSFPNWNWWYLWDEKK